VRFGFRSALGIRKSYSGSQCRYYQAGQRKLISQVMMAAVAPAIVEIGTMRERSKGRNKIRCRINLLPKTKETRFDHPKTI
jgi:hypothetical protein